MEKFGDVVDDLPHFLSDDDVWSYYIAAICSIVCYCMVFV